MLYSPCGEPADGRPQDMLKQLEKEAEEDEEIYDKMASGLDINIVYMYI